MIGFLRTITLDVYEDWDGELQEATSMVHHQFKEGEVLLVKVEMIPGDSRFVRFKVRDSNEDIFPVPLDCFIEISD